MKTLPGQPATPASSASTVNDAVAGKSAVLDFSVGGSEHAARTEHVDSAVADAPEPKLGRRATDVSPEPNTITSSSPPPPRLGKHCRFLLALVLFAAINLGLSFDSPFEFDPYKFVYRGWAWWNMHDLRQDTQIHNVALLGSSLMVSAVAGADANHLTKSLDLTQYHKAAYLDYLLSHKLKGDFNTFNLSAPGQMPSDAYLTLKSMINVSQRPEVVIYGIAPRDFIDSTLTSPVDTEPFRYLRRIVNIDDVASGLYHSPIPRLEWCLQRSVYLYANALDLQMTMNEWMTLAMAFVIPPPAVTTRPFTWWDRTHLLPQYLKGEIIPNSMLAVPITQAAASAMYSDNSVEYRERYKRPEPSTYQLQFYFLRRLAYYCRKEKIELVLVNMPITQTNVSLLNPSVYLQYVQAIKAFGYDNNVAVLDMCNWSQYTKDDFHDTVHLNAYGGKKFLYQLAQSLSAWPRTRLALEMAGAELHRHKAVAAGAKPVGVE